jgi:hypothetical protein
VVTTSFHSATPTNFIAGPFYAQFTETGVVAIVSFTRR